MILLALDTSDARGSVALLRDEELLHVIPHDIPQDYSSWLLPNVDQLLVANHMKMRDVECYAVAAGPGSFTGLRVGLTTVKAWSEVFGAKIAAVSRLEAVASQANRNHDFVAAFVDAQRDQLFAGLFRQEGASLQRIGEDMVIAPDGFLSLVEEQAGVAPVAWVSMDPDKLTVVAGWQKHQKRGEQVLPSSHVLAPLIGKLGLRQAQEGRLVDALTLDAQYVRRSDAEIFWKGATAR